MAVAALVLGILGTLFSLNWLTVWVGGPMAIIALVLGILARKALAAEGRPTGMATAGPMVADLRAESDDLDALVAALPAARWADATPAPGWTIAHQIAHLLWTDRVALTAVTDEAGFGAMLAEAGKDPLGFVDAGAEEVAAQPPESLFSDWRETRARLHAAGLLERLGSRPGLVLTAPLGYFELTALLCQAQAVLTDSGGVQEETTYLGVPCFTLRDAADRPVTTREGTNTLLGLDPERIAARCGRGRSGRARMTKQRRLRWGMQETPPTKHPYRDTALVYGGLAVLLVLFAWVTGGPVGRAVVIAIELIERLGRCGLRLGEIDGAVIVRVEHFQRAALRPCGCGADQSDGKGGQ